MNMHKLFIILLLAIVVGSCKKPEKFITAQVYTTFIKMHNKNEPNIMYYYVVEHPSGRVAYAQNSMAYTDWHLIVWSKSLKFPAFLFEQQAKRIGSVQIPLKFLPDEI